MCINDTYVYIKSSRKYLHEHELHLDVIASSSLSEQLSPKPASAYISFRPSSSCDIDFVILNEYTAVLTCILSRSINRRGIG